MLNINNSSPRHVAILPLTIAMSSIILTACNSAPKHNANVTTRTPVIVNPNATADNTGYNTTNDNVNYNAGANNNINNGYNVPNNYPNQNNYPNSNIYTNSTAINSTINNPINNGYNVPNNYANNYPNNPANENVADGYNNSINQNNPAYQQRPFVPNQNPVNNQGYNLAQNQNVQYPNNYSEPPISSYDKPYIADHVNSEKNRYQPTGDSNKSTNSNNTAGNQSNRSGPRSAYRVESGDSLSSIAERSGVSTSQLASWNDINPNDVLPANKTLYLYNGKTVGPRVKKVRSTQSTTQNSDYYLVRNGDTLIGTAHKVGLSVSQLASYNNLSTKAELRRGQRLWLIPNQISPRNTANKTQVSTTSDTRLSYQGQTSRYRVKSGDTLIDIAKKLNTTPNIIAHLNNFDSNYRLIKGRYITVPASKTYAEIKLNNIDASYKVKDGDTLIGLANRFKVSVSNLAIANNLTTNSHLIKGTTITIPAGSSVSRTDSTNRKARRSLDTTQAQEYTVESGDSLGYLASIYRMPISKIATANGLSIYDDLYIGQTVTIPAHTSSNASATSASSYIVRRGDSLTKLASRYGVTISQLAAMNGLSTDALLINGQAIKVPAQ